MHLKIFQGCLTKRCQKHTWRLNELAVNSGNFTTLLQHFCSRLLGLKSHLWKQGTCDTMTDISFYGRNITPDEPKVVKKFDRWAWKKIRPVSVSFGRYFLLTLLIESFAKLIFNHIPLSSSPLVWNRSRWHSGVTISEWVYTWCLSMWRGACPQSVICAETAWIVNVMNQEKENTFKKS